jgi:hypothetical protein
MVSQVWASFTWKCLQGCSRFFLKLLSKLDGYEKIMYIALVREKIGVVRTNRGVLVILDLLKSAGGTFSNAGFRGLRAAERYSDLGRK